MTQQQEAAGRKRGRSPSYPAIGLQEALRLARLLYDREGRSPAPIEAVVTDWGLKPTSGYGWVVVAALIKFGLLTDEGKGPSRKAKLTNLALDIVLDQREDNGRRKELIREAALKPTIHADLWKKYGPTLPSDATLRFYLEREKGFNPAAVPDLIKQFRQTVTFAELANSLTLSEDDADTEDQTADPFKVTLVTPAPVIEREPAAPLLKSKAGEIATMRVVTLPLPGDAWAALQIPTPMTNESWDYMLEMLKVMKRGIVGAPQPDSATPASESDPTS